MKQTEAVILTLEKLGGIATLGQLNHEVMKIEDCIWKTKTPFASIRRIVQLHKEIYKIKPGLYGLVKNRKELESKGIISETDKNKNSKEIQNFNHSYYQGIIIEVGNTKNYHTYIPNQDKNKQFLNVKLGEIRNLITIPEFSYPNFVQRSSTIDVIWFNERKMPHSFFEVEHSTDIQNSLIKFNDLQDFNTRMFIVADSNREDEFKRKLSYSVFKDIRNRVMFMDYNSLIKQYEFEMQKSSLKEVL